MKVLLYFEKEKSLRQSGIGRALRHQKKALEEAGVSYTLNPKEMVDVVHINTLFSKSYRLMRSFQKKGIPVIVHGHSTIEDFRYSFRAWKVIEPFFDRMLLRMYRQADAIITPTPYSKKLIASYKGVTCPIYDVSNGIDLNEYAYQEEKVQKFRSYFSLSPEQKVVIGVGLFFERKGIFDFFEVARSLPDVTFIWFGNLAKFMTQGKVLRAMKQRPSNVIMPGYIDGDIIKGAFSGADLVFFPSLEETEGIVVLEALASSTPVLVRDIPVFSPWLEDGKNCFMGKNCVEFKKKIEEALTMDCSQMVLEGKKVVEERSISKIGIKLQEIYEEVEKRRKNNGNGKN